eukprot:12927-Heterococcus_DN1.PRE.1
MLKATAATASADDRESDEWSSDDEVHRLPLERRQRFGGMLDHIEAVVGVVHACELFALYEFVSVFLSARRCQYCKKKYIAEFSLPNACTTCLAVSLLLDVWAKQTGFPAWPAIIWDPRFLEARMQKQARYSAVLQKSDVVWFYGSNPSFGVVPLTSHVTFRYACTCRDITPYEEAKGAMMLKRKLSGKNVKEINVAVQDCEEDLLKVCETTFLRLLEIAHASCWCSPGPGSSLCLMTSRANISNTRCIAGCEQPKGERLRWMRGLKERISMCKGGKKKAAAATKKPAAADGISSSSSEKSKSSAAASKKAAAAAALDTGSVGEFKESQYAYNDDGGGADSDGVR